MRNKDLVKNSDARYTSAREQVKAAYKAYGQVNSDGHSRYAVAISKSGNVYLKKAAVERDELDYTELAKMLASKR